MSIYQGFGNPIDDAGFEPGCLAHIVVGNTGRLLDPRRTPITITAVDCATGMFEHRIDAFEDRGATWRVPFERIDRYQFAIGSQHANEKDVQQFRAAIQKFDRPLRVDIDPAAAQLTSERLQAIQTHAGDWLAAHSQFVRDGGALPDPATRLGDARLFDDIERYMREFDVDAIETAFARQFVCNPHSGELIKGHRIVMAELGFATYDGPVVRDPALFDEPWSKPRRTEHILRRIGFVRALFDAIDTTHLTLYRGMYSDEPLRSPDAETFVSATPAIEVARSHFEADAQLNAALFRQRTPVTRIFMTYYETRAMNEQYREAEIVLLHEPGNSMF